ncbi:DUF2231 domain-containing protein [Ornithinimicrobium pekingense]|nr:DUF2231 domain-containing protein [Ornithinimicrobium pekingense]
MSTQPPNSDSSPLTGVTERIESAEALDGLAGRIGHAADALVSDPDRASLLRSGPLGHALHPVMTDIPLGAWMSAAVLDWTGGPAMRPATQRLVGLGNAAYLPTAITGLAEFAGLDARSKRVASVHAVANNIALGLNVASWFARRSDRHGLGRVLTAGAMTVGGFGAFLGGHLAIGMKAGSHDPRIARSSGHAPGEGIPV